MFQNYVAIWCCQKHWLISIDKEGYDPFGWCATEVDKDGNYNGNWDYCKENCESMKISAIEDLIHNILIYQFVNNL